jgi:hypothetical protein
MLARRPRLSFDESLKPTVVDVLAGHQPSVAAVAATVVADLVRDGGSG